jgi:hypothetical protein
VSCAAACPAGRAIIDARTATASNLPNKPKTLGFAILMLFPPGVIVCIFETLTVLP